MNENWLVKMELYLDGNLSPEDQLLFESELKTNEELAKIFDIYRAFEFYHNGATQMPLTEEQTNKEEALKLTLKKINAVYSPPEELIEAFRKPVNLLDKKVTEKQEFQEPATREQPMGDKPQMANFDREDKKSPFKLLTFRKWLP